MAEALTAQEQAIQEGKSIWVETSAGFNRLFDEIRRLPIRMLSTSAGTQPPKASSTVRASGVMPTMCIMG